MEHGINQVSLLGHLGADPELKLSADGQAILKLRLATTSKWVDKNNVKQEKTEWHRVAVFGRLAEALAKFLRKGMGVYVNGRLSYSSYEKDGQKRYSTDVIAEDVVVTTPKGYVPATSRSDFGDYGARPSAPNGASAAVATEIPF
ncbi:MAG: single-stranded DNA-binding protein [Labilithrix sp.]|nr:single-stranded DNA-binding protein [Labilithrix sp.]